VTTTGSLEVEAGPDDTAGGGRVDAPGAGEVLHEGQPVRAAVVGGVIPLSTAAHQGLNGGAFIIADFPAGKPPVAYQDTASRGRSSRTKTISKPSACSGDTLKSEALPRTATLALMREVESTWTPA
jgi:hypothetical protein